MTDDEFERIWALERLIAPREVLPDLGAMRAYVAKHPDGIEVRKLLRRYEAEGYTRADTQLAIQRLTDRLCRTTKDWSRIVARDEAAPAEDRS